VDVVLTTVAAAAGGLSHPGQSGVCTTMEQAGVGVDWSLPLLGSGVRDRCQPSATVTGRWLTAAGCVLRILGWGFATGFAAGFTGDFPEGMRLGRDEDPTGRWPQVFLHGSDTKSTQIDSRFSPHPALHQETRPARATAAGCLCWCSTSSALPRHVVPALGAPGGALDYVNGLANTRRTRR
jgi:hypothetical protein